WSSTAASRSSRRSGPRRHRSPWGSHWVTTAGRRSGETHIARTSPAVERAVSILNFLAEHESETFTLSELARRLDLAKATGHTILATLVDCGLVTRSFEREYCLGPAIIPLGE